MNRIVRFFRARSISLLIFHIGVLLFSWPLISIPTEAGGTNLFFYILGAWATLVGLLVFMGESIRRERDVDTKSGKEE